MEKRNHVVIPALIATTLEELQRMLEKVDAFADRIQLDIMDGRFVPSTSLPFSLPQLRRPERFEAHLMVADPDPWIKANAAQVGTVIPHLEISGDIQTTLWLIRSLGKRVALAINPETPCDRLLPFLDQLDQVLIMTVNPGFYGSPFLPETLEKVRELRHLRPRLDIEVDGGINPQTIRSAYEAGANLLVSGSYLLLAEDISLNMKTLRELVAADI